MAGGVVAPETVVMFTRWEAGGYFMDWRGAGMDFGSSFVSAQDGIGAYWNTFYINDSLTSSLGGLGALMNNTWQMVTFDFQGTGVGPLTMMSRFQDGQSSLGAFGEILVYDRELSEAERLELYTYMDQTWINPVVAEEPPALAIPEPSAGLLLSMTGLGLVGIRRRRRNIARVAA
jgi:hypothetical protein